MVLRWCSFGTVNIPLGYGHVNAQVRKKSGGRSVKVRRKFGNGSA